MIAINESELLAVRQDFCLLVARWRLTQAEVAALLGSEASGAGAGRVLPDVLDSSAEHQVRLLIRLDKALSALLPDADLATSLRQGIAFERCLLSLQSIRHKQTLRKAIHLIEGLTEQRRTTLPTDIQAS